MCIVCNVKPGTFYEFFCITSFWRTASDFRSDFSGTNPSIKLGKRTCLFRAGGEGMCYFLEDLLHKFRRLIPHPQNLTQLICIYPLATQSSYFFYFKLLLHSLFISGDKLAVVAWVGVLFMKSWSALFLFILGYIFSSGQLNESVWMYFWKIIQDVSDIS